MTEEERQERAVEEVEAALNGESVSDEVLANLLALALRGQAIADPPRADIRPSMAGDSALAERPPAPPERSVLEIYERGPALATPAETERMLKSGMWSRGVKGPGQGDILPARGFGSLQAKAGEMRRDREADGKPCVICQSERAGAITDAMIRGVALPAEVEAEFTRHDLDRHRRQCLYSMVKTDGGAASRKRGPEDRVRSASDHRKSHR